MNPRSVLLENVQGLNDQRIDAYRQAALESCVDLSYFVDWDLLEARDFGVPQLRPRMVLVALRTEYVPYFEWPEPKPTEETVGTALAS